MYGSQDPNQPSNPFEELFSRFAQIRDAAGNAAGNVGRSWDAAGGPQGGFGQAAQQVGQFPQAAQQARQGFSGILDQASSGQGQMSLPQLIQMIMRMRGQ